MVYKEEYKSMKNEVNKEYTASLETITIKREPFLYQVFIHNDDYTPMEFVVSILEKFFYMERRKATAVMLEAHLQGKAKCGSFSKDVAESKIAEVNDYARVSEHPLICSMEIA